MQPVPRQQIGDYLLLDLLGQGGMGSVFLARHVEHGEQVALKVMASHLTQHPQVVKRFETEARAVMRIDHPNVVKIHDYGSLEDGTLYHVLELLQGQELYQLMEHRRRFTAREALPYVQQICEALQAAHDRAIVHRDLKPENVFVLDGEPMRLKVLDFGIAKMLDPDEFLNLTATGIAIGTPMFIAPEQALGDKHAICPQTDLYSLGVIVYAMLCGAPPFKSDAPGALLAMHIKDPPPPLRRRRPSVPDAVARLVHSCLEKEPQRRPRSARELAQAYEQALGQAPTPRPEVTRRTGSEPMQFQPRSTVPDAVEPGQGHDTIEHHDTVEHHDTIEQQDTIIDPRFQHHGPLTGPTTVDPAARHEGIGPRVTPTEPIPPSVLLGQTRPPRRMGPAHWIALGLAVVGLGLIVALVLLAVHLMQH